jgi:hypothetical protein
MKFVAMMILWCAAWPAAAGGFGPWTFGMSVEQIRAVDTHGPYRAFSNGDLETYNADFGGRKENAQFYLREGRLWRVALRTYEGTGLDDAAAAWKRTYTTLQALHGPVETPDFPGGDLAALAEAAKARVAGGDKTQMAPVEQPAEAFVFSSFNGHTVAGTTYYTVTVYYDQPTP